jgi:hypothetical protein
VESAFTALKTSGSKRIFLLAIVKEVNLYNLKTGQNKKYFADSENVCIFATSKTNNSNTKYTNNHNTK